MKPLGRRDLLLGGAALWAGRAAFGQAKILAPGYRERQALVNDLVAANHILSAHGIVDAFGHVSVRTAPGASRYLISRSLAPAQVTSDDILELDLDSKPVADDSRGLYLERFIHGEIYKARPDVMSVVHCHAPSLIPYGITGVALRPVYHNSSFVGEGVPVFEIRDAAGDTDMLVSSPALGAALARTLEKKPAVLMRGHGAVIVGKSIMESVARSVYLEVNARVQSQAIASGYPVNYLSPEEVAKRGAVDEFSRAWELWKREVSQGVR
jgi:HCOMODA/2-hydroxy-3-carboxy-muconic semialdehyde decarboxylase